MFLILVGCSVLAYGLVFTLLIYLVQRNDVERGREHAKVLSTKSAEMLSSQLGQHWPLPRRWPALLAPSWRGRRISILLSPR